MFGRGYVPLLGLEQTLSERHQREREREGERGREREREGGREVPSFVVLSSENSFQPQPFAGCAVQPQAARGGELWSSGHGGWIRCFAQVLAGGTKGPPATNLEPVWRPMKDNFFSRGPLLTLASSMLASEHVREVQGEPRGKRPCDLARCPGWGVGCGECDAALATSGTVHAQALVFASWLLPFCSRQEFEKSLFARSPDLQQYKPCRKRGFLNKRPDRCQFPDCGRVMFGQFNNIPRAMLWKSRF